MINSSIYLSEIEVANIPKSERPEYQKFTHLIGIGISLAEGGRKYGIGFSTISRWVKRGFILVLYKQGQKVFLDEADLAYCSDIYHSIPSMKRGHRIFSSDGTPKSKAI